jgi:hypothetical protein
MSPDPLPRCRGGEGGLLPTSTSSAASSHLDPDLDPDLDLDPDPERSSSDLESFA